MKMEHINENTIKVMIAASDLEERGITFFDLLGSQKKIENFFYSILEEVGVSHEFEGLDAVTFQVVPKNDGLDLYITKGMADNLKDTLKSSVENMVKEQPNTPLDKVIQQIEQNLSINKAEDTNNVKEQVNTQQTTSPKETQVEFQAFVFDHFKHYVALSKCLPSADVGENHLYHYNGHYYWTHKSESRPAKEYIYYQAIEHGEPSSVSHAYLNEHAQHVMESEAMKITKKYFN